MRLRGQLILAFFLLAVLPLAGASLYSYRASLSALQEAVQAESDELAREMEGRMETVTADLRRRMDRLSGLPLWAVEASDRAEGLQEHLQRLVKQEMGDSFQFVEQLEFLPAAPADPGEPSDAPAPAPQIRMSHDLGREANPDPETGATLVMEEEGALVLRIGSAEGAGPSGDAAPAHSAGVDEAAAPEPGAEWARGLAALARHLEERDRLRKAGAELPEVDVDDFRQRLVRDLELPDGVSSARIGSVRAQISSRTVLREVMSRTRRDRGEVPFAIDDDNVLYTPDPADRPTLARLGIGASLTRGESPTGSAIVGDWVTVLREDPNSGLYFGIARPVGGALQELRATAARNLGLGMGMVGMALLGILPLSGRMTRNLQRLTGGAEALARGDLDARVPVRSRDEFGTLAGTFNRMAEQLKESQKRLVQQERLRREVEIGREIQQELLPQDTLSLPFAEIRGVSIPAREVGGDFYNYFALPDGQVAVLVGDVSGKGVPAALLMANLQATLRAVLPSDSDLAGLIGRLNRDIEAQTPASAFVTLFVGVLDGATGRLRCVNAGHNPPFVLRPDGGMSPLHPSGRPVGMLPGGDYREESVSLPAGSILFLYTDGVTESESPDGQEFGMERLESVLGALGGAGVDRVLERVEEAVRDHSGPGEAADDATMLALRFGGG